MIDLNDYISKYNVDQIFRNQYYYQHLVEYYNGHKNIPDRYIQKYNNCNLNNFNYIYENLNTHDYKKLQNYLIKEYNQYIDSFKNYDGDDNIKSFYIILKKLLNINNLLIDKFFNILLFFNYQYSDIFYVDNKYALYIEPIYSKDMTDYFNKCHRQAYHFTRKENINKILKSGLRLKRGTYRTFPERIYLWVTDNKQDINNDNKKLLEFIHTIFGNDKLSLEDIGIIKVDLYHTNYPVYKDTSMKDKEALFIYNSIPPELCKEIKLKDI